jgi:hypothetical protein
LDKLLSMRIFEDWQMQKFFDSKTKNLENDIHSSTTRFRILKSAFHDFQYKISAKHENQEL